MDNKSNSNNKRKGKGKHKSKDKLCEQCDTPIAQSDTLCGVCLMDDAFDHKEYVRHQRRIWALQHPEEYEAYRKAWIEAVQNATMKVCGFKWPEGSLK